MFDYKLYFPYNIKLKIKIPLGTWIKLEIIPQLHMFVFLIII